MDVAQVITTANSKEGAEKTCITEKEEESAVAKGDQPEAKTTHAADLTKPLKRKIDNQQEVVEGTAKKQKRHDHVTEEIQHYQNSTEFLIAPILFHKIVAEVMEDIQPDLKFDSAAIEALQEAAEGYIVSMFRDIDLGAKQAKRVTVMLEDLLLASRVNGRYSNSDTNSPRALRRARLEQQQGFPIHPATSSGQASGETRERDRKHSSK